jgi:phosphate-selective porin OprO/OprP
MRLVAFFCTSVLAFSPYALASEAELEKKIQLLEQKITRLEQALNFVNTKVAQVPSVTTNITTKQEFIADREVSDAKGSKPEPSVKLSITPHPKIESADGRHSFAINGYLQNDFAFFSNDKKKWKDGAILRNARLIFSGKFDSNWYYLMQSNFAGQHAKIVNAVIDYKATENTGIAFGIVPEPIGFEEQQANKFLTFMERPSITTFAPGMAYGAFVYNRGANWSLTGGLFGNSTSITDNTGSQQKSVTGRASFAPINDNDNFVHLGLSASYRVPSAKSKELSYKVKPESHIADSLLDTKLITGVKNNKIVGLEFAAGHGPFSVQTEYMHNMITRNGFKNSVLNGGYVQAAWTLTGEHKSYTPTLGVMGTITPNSPFSLKEGGLGAWEVAARYNYINLNNRHKTIIGGKMNNYGFALNWYPNTYVRFMADYIIVNSDKYAVVPKNKPKILMLRTQFGF